MDTSDSEGAKRRIRRCSSLYNSTSLQSESEANQSKLIYAAQLNNEKMQWIEFQNKVLCEKKKPSGPVKCDHTSIFSIDIKEYCKAAPDMIKFAADTREFIAKAEMYIKMESYYQKKLSYTENRLKENVDDVTTKVFVDQIMEKINLK